MKWIVNIFAGGWLGVLYVVMSGTFASAFDWKSPDWLRSGCPESFEGRWVPHLPAGSPNESLRVGGGDYHLYAKSGEFVSVPYERQMDSGFYVVLSLSVPESNLSEQMYPYLKIRPYQVLRAPPSSEGKSSYRQCLIKVFRYESLEHVRMGKYANWQVYEIHPD